MKKLLVLIITSLGIFSIFSYANAREGSLERALDLEYGPEAFELALPEIWNYYLKNTKNKNALKTFKTADSILKEAFMRDYRDGKFDYIKINAIIAMIILARLPVPTFLSARFCTTFLFLKSTIPYLIIYLIAFC